MDVLAASLGIITGIVALMLSVSALWSKIVRAVREVVDDALFDMGLTKRGKKQEQWPNGSDNLPDSLEHFYKELKVLSSTQNEILDKLKELKKAS